MCVSSSVGVQYVSDMERASILKCCVSHNTCISYENAKKSISKCLSRTMLQINLTCFHISAMLACSMHQKTKQPLHESLHESVKHEVHQLIYAFVNVEGLCNNYADAMKKFHRLL